MSNTTPEGKLLDRWKLLAAISRDPSMSRGDIAVAGVLLELFNEQFGCAWPGRKLVAEMAGVHERTVVSSCRKLEAKGYFTVICHGGGRKATNNYVPNWQAADDAAVNKRVASTPPFTVDDEAERVASTPPFTGDDETKRVASNVQKGGVQRQKRVAWTPPNLTYKNISKNLPNAHARASDPDPTEALAHKPPPIPADSDLVDTKIARQDGAGINGQPYPISPSLAEQSPKVETGHIVCRPWPLGEARQTQHGHEACHPVLKSLAGLVPPPVMRSYFGKVQVREDGGTLRLIFPLTFTCRMAKDNYGDVVSRAATRHGYKAVIYDGGAAVGRASAFQCAPLARAS